MATFSKVAISAICHLRCQIGRSSHSCQSLFTVYCLLQGSLLVAHQKMLYPASNASCEKLEVEPSMYVRFSRGNYTFSSDLDILSRSCHPEAGFRTERLKSRSKFEGGGRQTRRLRLPGAVDTMKPPFPREFPTLGTVLALFLCTVCDAK